MNLHRLVILSLLPFLGIPGTESFRILGLFPHSGVSHFHFFHPLMRGLAKSGHEVTVVSYFPDKNPVKNYTDLQLTDLSPLTDFLDIKLFERSYMSTNLKEFFMIHEFGLLSCKALLNSNALTQVLNSPKSYDVIIVEQFNSDCVSGVSYLFKAPIIGLSSSALMPWHHKRMGSPGIPSYIPVIFLGHSEQMGYFSRIKNFIFYHTVNFLYRYLTQVETNKLIKKRFGDSVPNLEDIENIYSLFLVNQHYSLSGSKPLSPAVVEVGGLHIENFEPLNSDIKQILDTADHGIIYISWGSLIRSETLPVEKREAILRAVSRFDKMIVLWKWENETIPNQPENVYIKKWMPQKEILCHPNVKVFMSHGGLLGSSEAAYCGVPVVVTPILGDQFLNAAALEHRGMATILQLNEITEESVFNAITKVLSHSFWDNAKKVSYSYRNRPEKPLDTAIWWVEHVIETRGSPLTRSVLTNLPWYIENSFDVYAFFVIIAFIFYIIVKFLFKLICNRKKDTGKVKTS